MSFTYATVCSGVEGCSLALEGMDWKPVFFSEIEPFPCAVLKSHYPDVPNLGDMSKISYNKEKGIITNGTRTIQFSGRLDLLAGGTPCQDFSVAGKRAGGEKGSGTRSSLCWEWLRLVSELDPRVVLWENVVGTFSSNNGRDFYEFVREVANLGYCVSWRVLDAQFTRVDKWPMAIPQRRRRVWVVGCATDNVTEVAEILFEHRSIVGDTPPRRVTRQEASRIAQNCHQVHADVVGASYGIGNGQVNSAQITIGAKEVSQTLDCMEDPQKVMIEHEVYRIDAMQSNSMKSSNPDSGIHKVTSAQTLDTTVPTPTKNQGGDIVVGTLDLMGGKTGAHYGDGETSPTLTHGRGSASDVHAVVSQGCDTYNQSMTGDVSPTIRGTASDVDHVGSVVSQGMTFDAHMGFPTIDEVSQTLKNGTSPGSHNGVVISTNSNGGDVMPTINANESKLGGDNQHITGGGTLSVNFEMYDTAEDVNVSLCAKRARDCMVITDESLDAANQRRS